MIDVLIPVYNAQDTVRESLLSILNQSFCETKVIVVDDGSSDATPEILRSLSNADSRLQVITKANGGIVDALNLGLSHCTAEYIARHDADDIAYPNRLAKQIAYMTDYEDCIALGCNTWKIDQFGRRIGRTYVWGEPPAEWDAVPSIEPYIMHPFLMARRRAFDTVCGYRYVFQAEDTDLYWRLREHGRLHNLDELLGEYRMHQASVTNGSVVAARIGAINSQLAAVSARRRAEGKNDLSFAKGNLERYRAAETLEAMFSIAAEQLTPSENSYLRRAAAAKLIELRAYRSFRIQPSDIRTILPTMVMGLKVMSKRDRWILLRSVILWIRPKFGLKRLWARHFMREPKNSSIQSEPCDA